jgi:hypothetical protein
MRPLLPNLVCIALGAAALALVCRCQNSLPITPPVLTSPLFTKITLTDAKVAGSYGAVHLEWTPPSTDSDNLRSFTIIKKTGDDSLFDQFFSSSMIWDSVRSFDDKLPPNSFPTNGYLLLQYRIFAVDGFGRSSDTSAPCSLYVAPQPIVDTVDTLSWCIGWESRHIMGSVSAYLTAWNSTGSWRYRSDPQEKFGSENFPILFSGCLPDSLKHRIGGKLYFAIFLQASGHQSLLVDSVNAP